MNVNHKKLKVDNPHPFILYYTYKQHIKRETIHMQTKTRTFTTRQMTLIGLVTAITCLIAPFSIPIPVSPVPISLTNLILYLSVYVLGMKYSTISYAIYLLLGLVGLPVFSGFSGGIGKLGGPTGGYLVGFIFLTLISGFFVEKFRQKIAMEAAGMILGTVVAYLFGTIWICAQMHISFVAGLSLGVFPYLIGDVIKIIAACIVGPKLFTAVRRDR